MRIKPREKRERNWLYDILIISILVFIFYTAWLGSYPLFTPDEGRYSEVAREMVISGDYITPRVDGVAFLDKPILYYWLQASAIHLFGLKEWGLRIFPVLFGIFGCLLVYGFGRKLFDRRTGILSAIILATTPLYFGCAHYASLDLEVAVLISCTLLSFLAATHSTGKQRVILFFVSYIFSALAFLTKGMIGIAFPIMIIGSWIIILWRWDLLLKIKLLGGMMIFAVIVFPWYYLVQKANPEFLHYFFVTQQVIRFLSSSKFNNQSPFWFYIPIIFVGFFPWVIFLYQGIKKYLQVVWQLPKTHSKELFLLLWIVIVFIFFSTPKSKTVSYILPIFPALALMVGNYLSSIWNETKDVNISLIGLIAGGCMLAFILYASWLTHLVDYPVDFNIHLAIINFAVLANGVIALLLTNRSEKKILIIFGTCTLSSIVLLLSLVSGTKHLNFNTAKPLMTHLKQVIKPQDEVITYFKYYQDLPLYLERRISIVADWSSPDLQRDNWFRELWNGMAFQKTDDWLINEKQFWQRWHSDKKLYVFINSNWFLSFIRYKQQFYKQFYFFDKYNDIIIISNKPIT